MPRGPLPADVYWRRRLLLLTILIALAWGAVELVGWVRDRDEPAPAATPAASPSPEETTEPEPEPDDLLPVSITAPDGACAPENIRIVPSAADGQPAGADVTLDLLVSTVDGSGCVLDPADAELLVIIERDGDTLYDSTACRESLLTDPVAVPAGWAVQTPITWNGRASGGSCGDGERYLDQGEYTVQIGTLGGEPGEATVRLAEPEPEPEPEATEGAEETEEPPAEGAGEQPAPAEEPPAE